MNPIILKCLLSTVCFAVPSLVLPAQSGRGVTAPPEAQDPSPKPTAAKERMQVRLAEVLAMLDEDDLSPAQRLKVKAKLQEVMERLAKEQATESGSATAPGRNARSVLRTVDGEPKPRVRARVIETEGEPGKVVRVMGAEGGEVEVVELAEIAEIAEMGESAELAEVVEPAAPAPAKSPRAPKDPRAPKAPKAPKAPRAIVIDANDADGAMDQGEFAKARVLLLEADKAYELAEKDLLRAKLEVQGKAGRPDVREGHSNTLRYALQRARGDHAATLERKARLDAQRADAERSSVKALKLLHEARAAQRQAEDRKAEPRATDPRVRARVLHVDSDDSDVREMIEEMRAEMREIRSLLKELRQKSEELTQNTFPHRGALRAFAPSGGVGQPAAPTRAIGSFPGIGTTSGTVLPSGAARAFRTSGQNLAAPAPVKATGAFRSINNLR